MWTITQSFIIKFSDSEAKGLLKIWLLSFYSPIWLQDSMRTNGLPSPSEFWKIDDLRPPSTGWVWASLQRLRFCPAQPQDTKACKLPRDIMHRAKVHSTPSSLPVVWVLLDSLLHQKVEGEVQGKGPGAHALGSPRLTSSLRASSELGTMEVKQRLTGRTPLLYSL